MAWLAFQRRPRSFRRDSRMLVDRLTPPLLVEGALPDVERGSWLVVVNHYTRPGFRAWWIPMAISTTLPRELTWVTTSTLTFRDPLRAATITPASRWFLRRVASLYGFIAMPPMPPRDFEVKARAEAVRRALHRASEPHALLGLAPEGGDMPRGVLRRPIRLRAFLQHLARRASFQPVGAFCDDGRCACVAPFDLPFPPRARR
jgi:hypothetical protein